MKNIVSEPIQNYIPFVLEKNRNSLREKRRFFWKEDVCTCAYIIFEISLKWTELNYGETERDLSMKVPGLQYLFSVYNVVQTQNNWRSGKCGNKVIGRRHLEVYQSDLFIKRERSKMLSSGICLVLSQPHVLQLHRSALELSWDSGASSRD